MPAPSPASDIHVFDRARIRHNRERAAPRFAAHDFLFRHAANALSDRLGDIARTFPLALHIGGRSPLPPTAKIEQRVVMDLACLDTAHIQADEEFLPFATHSFDLITSTLTLHSVNDLVGALLQIRQALKPDGLFMASLLGGETLHELRHTLTQTEIVTKGGLSPRVFPFADKAQMGDLLTRAGFTLPVVDSEIVTVTYPNAFKLFHDLRGMGEGNAIAARDKAPLPRAFFLDAARRYHDDFSEPDGRIPATFELIHLIGWSPHPSQQQPLRPNSATHSLAQALGTTEVKTGDPSAP